MIFKDFPVGSRFHHQSLGITGNLFKKKEDIASRALAGDKKADALFSMFLDYSPDLRENIQKSLDNGLGKIGDEALEKFKKEYFEFRLLFIGEGKKFFNNYFAALVENGLVRNLHTLKEVKMAHEELLHKCRETCILSFLSPLISVSMVKTAAEIREYGDALHNLQELADDKGTDFALLYHNFMLPLVGASSPGRKGGKPIKNAADLEECGKFILDNLNGEQPHRSGLLLIFHQKVLPEIERSGKDGAQKFKEIFSECLKDVEQNGVRKK